MNTEHDNRMVWDRQRAGHYEVWYVTLNHPPSGTGFWIRYTLEAPATGEEEPYCQLWFAAFRRDDPARNVAINRRLPIAKLRSVDDPFEVAVGEAVLRHGSLRGQLAGDSHEVSWDLGFKPSIFTHRHLPDMLYGSKIASTNVLSPNLMIHLNGRIEVDGEAFDLDAAPGCQTHLWGRKHAHAWAWGHCSAFREDPTACLELFSARVKRFGLVTPPLTMLSLYLGSEVYHFRQLRSLPRNRGRWETGLYRFSAVGNRVKVEGEMRCRPEDLIQAHYSDPDGESAFCHNTEVADASVTVWTRRSLGVPFRKTSRLTSRGMAHFEYAHRTPDGQVPRRHVTVS